MQDVLPLDEEDEEYSERDVTDVGEDVVEVGEEEERVGAEEVVVAHVQVAGGVGDILHNKRESD